MWATADSIGELFDALGLGLFALMTDLRKVRRRDERAVQAGGGDPVALVVAYLSELLALHAEDGFVAREVHCRPVGSPPTAVLARLVGEPFTTARHSRHFEVKAITFPRLEMDLARRRARVIVDI